MRDTILTTGTVRRRRSLTGGSVLPGDLAPARARAGRAGGGAAPRPRATRAGRECGIRPGIAAGDGWDRGLDWVSSREIQTSGDHLRRRPHRGARAEEHD